MEIIIQKILDIVNSTLKDANVNNIITIEQINEELSQFGIDSITFIRIIVAIEEVFGIEVPDEKLLMSEMGTIFQMSEVIQDVLKGSGIEGELS